MITTTSIILVLIFGWIFYRTILYSKFEPKGIDTDCFKEMQYEDIPYIMENNIPYKGDINSVTNIKKDLKKDFKFSADNDSCNKDGINGEYEKVCIPYCFNKIGSSLQEYKGDVWFEKDFEIEKIENMPVIRLNFLGCFLKTDVWIDGEHYVQNIEGYLPFSLDISHLSSGKHKLVLKINNEIDNQTLPTKLFEEHKSAWHLFSGIHKDIYIEYQSQISIFKLKCIPRKQDSGWVVETSTLMERLTYDKEKSVECSLKISDANKKIVAEKEISITFNPGERVSGKTVSVPIESPQLWDADSPTLYTITAITEYEKSFVSFGLREVSWADGKIFINSKPTFLKGISRHESNFVKDSEEYDKQVVKEFDLIKAANANFARLSHYPHGKSTLKIADEKGVFVWEEIPFYQVGLAIAHDMFRKQKGKGKIHKFNIKKVVVNILRMSMCCDGDLTQKAAQSLIKMVERDINHPSVISWGIGDEIWSLCKSAGKVCKWLKETVKRYDSSRAVNYAAMCVPALSVKYETSFKHMDWVCLNQFYGWYYGKLEKSKKLAEKIYKRYPQKPLVITETGSDALYGLREENTPPKDRYSEDYQSYFIKETWKNLASAPSFSGFTVGFLKDFSSPEYCEENPLPFYNLKGILDKDLKPKQSYNTLKQLYAKKD